MVDAHGSTAGTREQSVPGEETELAVGDDWPVRRLGIVAALQARGFAVAEFDGDPDLIRWAARHGADRRGAVVCIDGPDGATRIGSLRSSCEALVIVALLSHSSADSVRSALLAGATAALPLGATPDTLADGVVAALRGHTLIAHGHALALALGSTVASPLAAVVSPTERDWLDLLASGITIADMAAAAAFSEREMHRRLGRLDARLGAHNRSQALVTAARHGLLTPKPEEVR
jgi:DNA-binding NarL/FixJ family response regulator